MFLNKLKQSLKQVKNNQGFSLIELLVVIGIIGILAAVAIPSYNAYQANAKRGVDDSVFQTALRTVQINQSLGVSTDAVELSTKIKSKGVAVPASVFNVYAGTNETIGSSASAWCVGINQQSSQSDNTEEKDNQKALLSGTKLKACINATGNITRAGNAIGVSCNSINREDCNTYSCTWTEGSSGSCTGTPSARGTCDSGGNCS